MKIEKEELTQKELKKIIRYRPTIGDFIWRISYKNNIKIGAKAGWTDTNGYYYIQIGNKKYRAHRLAWLYMEGFFPKNIDIDHKDRIRNNNKWGNLRLASKQCNARNNKKRNDNTSGVTGVVWYKAYKKWRATIAINGKKHNLGYFKNFSEAVLYRLAAEQCLNWEGCNSTTPAYVYSKNNGLIF